MTTKTEEKIKLLLKEFLLEKEKNVDSIIIKRSLSLIMWGFLIGALISYLSLLPFFLGLIIGIFLYKNNPFMINVFIDKFLDVVCSLKINKLFNKN